MTRHNSLFIAGCLTLLCVIIAGCREQKSQPEETSKATIVKPQETVTLWNGQDFTGWKLYLPDENADPHATWSVVDGVIHCTGVPGGYMRTEADYADYVLRLEWRWPAEPGNSGVLLHVSGPDEVWPRSIECQLMADNAGDFWVIGGTDFTERTDKSTRRVVKRGESSEKPVGEWNAYKIVCRGNTIQCSVTGVLQNEATGTTVTSGKIGIQSEGKPIEFRNIRLEPVD